MSEVCVLTYVIVNGSWRLSVSLVHYGIFHWKSLSWRISFIQRETSHENLHVFAFISKEATGRRGHISLHSVSLSELLNAYMQWPAVKTQQLLMRTPPQTCLYGRFEFFGFCCKETCQGIAPGETLRPPKIRVIAFLGWGTPQVRNCDAAASVGEAGPAEGRGGKVVDRGLADVGCGLGGTPVGPTAENKQMACFDVRRTHSEKPVLDLNLTCWLRTRRHVAVVPQKSAASSEETPRLWLSVWVPVWQKKNQLKGH